MLQAYTGGSIPKCSSEQRVEYTREMCQNLKIDDKTRRRMQASAHRHIVVDEKHKILLCVPYKSGASTHLNLLAQNSDAVLLKQIPDAQLHKVLNSLSDAKSRRRVGLKDFTAFSSKEGQKLLDDFFKVTVVRHPFVRLLSMYLNKVGRFNNQTGLWDCSDNYYGTDLAKWIESKHPQRGANCSLDLFVDFMLNHRTNMLRDMHTAPMHEWCGPCDIKYDYIVRLETGDSDQRYLLQRINPDFKRTLHENTQLHRSADFSDRFEDRWPQFRDVSDAQLDGLRDIYGLDLELFGYEYERSGYETSLKTSCRVGGHSKSWCC